MTATAEHGRITDRKRKHNNSKQLLGLLLALLLEPLLTALGRHPRRVWWVVAITVERNLPFRGGLSANKRLLQLNGLAILLLQLPILAIVLDQFG